MLDLNKPMMVLGQPGSSVRYLGKYMTYSGRTDLFVAPHRLSPHGKKGEEYLLHRFEDGRLYQGKDAPFFDVVNVPPEPEVRFINVYQYRNMLCGPGAGHKELTGAIQLRSESEGPVLVLKRTVVDGGPETWEIAHVYAYEGEVS